MWTCLGSAFSDEMLALFVMVVTVKLYAEIHADVGSLNVPQCQRAATTEFKDTQVMHHLPHLEVSSSAQFRSLLCKASTSARKCIPIL